MYKYNIYIFLIAQSLKSIMSALNTGKTQFLMKKTFQIKYLDQFFGGPLKKTLLERQNKLMSFNLHEKETKLKEVNCKLEENISESMIIKKDLQSLAKDEKKTEIKKKNLEVTEYTQQMLIQKQKDIKEREIQLEELIYKNKKIQEEIKNASNQESKMVIDKRNEQTKLLDEATRIKEQIKEIQSWSYGKVLAGVGLGACGLAVDCLIPGLGTLAGAFVAGNLDINNNGKANKKVIEINNKVNQVRLIEQKIQNQCGKYTSQKIMLQNKGKKIMETVNQTQVQLNGLIQKKILLESEYQKCRKGINCQGDDLKKQILHVKFQKKQTEDTLNVLKKEKTDTQAKLKKVNSNSIRFANESSKYKGETQKIKNNIEDLEKTKKASERANKVAIKAIQKCQNDYLQNQIVSNAMQKCQNDYLWKTTSLQICYPIMVPNSSNTCQIHQQSDNPEKQLDQINQKHQYSQDEGPQINPDENSLLKMSQIPEEPKDSQIISKKSDHKMEKKLECPQNQEPQMNLIQNSPIKMSQLPEDPQDSQIISEKSLHKINEKSEDSKSQYPKSEDPFEPNINLDEPSFYNTRIRSLGYRPACSLISNFEEMHNSVFELKGKFLTKFSSKSSIQMQAYWMRILGVMNHYKLLTLKQWKDKYFIDNFFIPYFQEIGEFVSRRKYTSMNQGLNWIDDSISERSSVSNNPSCSSTSNYTFIFQEDGSKKNLLERAEGIQVQRLRNYLRWSEKYPNRNMAHFQQLCLIRDIRLKKLLSSKLQETPKLSSLERYQKMEEFLDYVEGPRQAQQIIDILQQERNQSISIFLMFLIVCQGNSYSKLKLNDFPASKMTCLQIGLFLRRLKQSNRLKRQSLKRLKIFLDQIIESKDLQKLYISDLLVDLILQKPEILGKLFQKDSSQFFKLLHHFRKLKSECRQHINIQNELKKVQACQKSQHTCSQDLQKMEALMESWDQRSILTEMEKISTQVSESEHQP